MFRFADARISIFILLMMSLQIFLALSSAPLPFNPLFFALDDAGTIALARFTFWYVLLPFHGLEAVVAVVVAVQSKQVRHGKKKKKKKKK
jgi:hypothetical protein